MLVNKTFWLPIDIVKYDCRSSIWHSFRVVEEHEHFFSAALASDPSLQPLLDLRWLPSPGWASLLAIPCAFYAIFASPSQDILSGIWGGRDVSRFTLSFEKETRRKHNGYRYSHTCIECSQKLQWKFKTLNSKLICVVIREMNLISNISCVVTLLHQLDWRPAL